MADAVVLEISAGFAFTAIHELLELCLKDSQLQKLAGSHYWACENNKAVKLFISPDNYPCLPKSTLKLKKNVFQFCLFLTLSAYYSQIVKKDIYLNSGLTSTKNYGKTILTKVEEYPPHVCLLVMCAMGLWQTPVLSQKRAAGFPFEWDLWGQGYRS